MTDLNLRISEKVQLLVEGTLDQDNLDKFYKHLTKQQTLLDPDNEQQTTNMVQSIMHTLYIENATVNPRERRFKDHNDGRGFKLEDLENMKVEDAKKKEYNIYKDVAVVDVEVAKRPKYQLLASIWYTINFYLRRIERKTDLFKSLDRQYAEDQNPKY